MVHHVRRTILNRSAMKASGAPYAWFHWWACLDSNQEPDRYERPALTIELQAPPRAAARGGRQRCRHRLQGRPRSGNHWRQCFNPSLPGLPPSLSFGGRARLRPGEALAETGPGNPSSKKDSYEAGWMPGSSPGTECVTGFCLNPPKRPRTPPPCAISRSRRRRACRIPRASSVSGCRRLRRAGPPVLDPSAPRRRPC